MTDSSVLTETTCWTLDLMVYFLQCSGNLGHLMFCHSQPQSSLFSISTEASHYHISFSQKPHHHSVPPSHHCATVSQVDWAFVHWFPSAGSRECPLIVHKCGLATAMCNCTWLFNTMKTKRFPFSSFKLCGLDFQQTYRKNNNNCLIV